jgi:Uma2 family endonuclease
LWACYNFSMATIPHVSTGALDLLPLWQFSTARYLEMIEKGILGPKDRVELIGGVIVNMSPAGSRHNHFLGQLNRLFVPIFDKYEVWIQGTMIVSEGQVYDPDFLLLQRKPGGYKDQLPKSRDVLLVVEAAESSLRRDQQIKLPMYAAAGIAEYWIADLDKEVILVHREPVGDSFCSVEPRQHDEIISPLAGPEVSFAVRQAFD